MVRQMNGRIQRSARGQKLSFSGYDGGCRHQRTNAVCLFPQMVRRVRQILVEIGLARLCPDATSTKNLSVSEIVREYGFRHMGNFGEDYSTRLGENPSEIYRFGNAGRD